MKAFFTENLGLKISAVLISLFLWFFITSRGQSEITFDIPLEFKNIPAETGIVYSSVRTVSVTVRGHERLMKNLKASDMRVYVDLSRAKQGEDVFYINKDNIKLPYALSVMNIVPPTVRIRLEETVSKTVPVDPVVNGEPLPGFKIDSVRAEPSSVLIKGLKSELRRIRAIKTEPLDITDSNKSMTRQVSIDTNGTNVTPEADSVKVIIHISGRQE